MKIIRTSNYNIESEAQYVVAEGIRLKSQADIMCLALNEHPGRSDYDYFQVVEDDHKLWRGMADIVGEPDERVVIPQVDPNLGI